MSKDIFEGVDLSTVEQNGWVYFNYGWCVAVLPQKNIRGHVVREDTQCWCGPKEEPIYGGDPSLLVSHNDKKDPEHQLKSGEPTNDKT